MPQRLEHVLAHVVAVEKVGQSASVSKTPVWAVKSLAGMDKVEEGGDQVRRKVEGDLLTRIIADS
jgi:hypothetical protein